jgi:hypothetical protein
MHLFLVLFIPSWLEIVMFPPKGGEKLLHLSCRVFIATIGITKNLLQWIKILREGRILRITSMMQRHQIG